MNNNVLYFYWGFLGDVKYKPNGEIGSFPDGNAFYSWSIISELQKQGKNVYIIEDRDKIGYEKLQDNLFNSFAKKQRLNCYKNLKIFNKNIKLDYAILEFRWPIPGRNTKDVKGQDIWQPDLEYFQNCVKFCNDNNIPFVVFDLDYKIKNSDIKKYGIKYIIELGDKWKNSNKVKSAKVQIPFDFSVINEKPIKANNIINDCVYVGSRYERDWCLHYLPEKTVVHGNWLEPGHGDSANEFPHLDFRKRVSASEIFKPYNDSLVTVLLAKKEYCKKHFMTARIQESVFYGLVPLFIKEYGNDTIKQYAGKYWKLLKVKSRDDVKNVIQLLKNDLQLRKEIIQYLRKHLRFMDSKFFINDIEELLGVNND